MHIKDKLKGIDFLFKKLCANRNSITSPDFNPGGLSIKRNIKHSFDIPKRINNQRFSVIVRDGISFAPHKGPFGIEVIVVGTVFLREEMKTSVLRQILKDKENVRFLINQCLPHSSAAVAYLTDRMGFSPLILTPKFPAVREG